MANKKDKIKLFLDHPDRDQIVSQMVIGISFKDIHETLSAKYSEINRDFVISEKDLKYINDNYLDIYTKIKDDLYSVNESNRDPEKELNEAIQKNPTYHQKLNEYIDKEIDIKTVVKKLVVGIEHRASQVFDLIQEDPRNIKMDRTLIEWFNSLTAILEKYDTILNGGPDQIMQQNNINIQVVDRHIDVVFNVIKEILSKLDHETSMLFIDMFNQEMQKLKAQEIKMLPIDERLQQAEMLKSEVIGSLHSNNE